MSAGLCAVFFYVKILVMQKTPPKRQVSSLQILAEGFKRHPAYRAIYEPMFDKFDHEYKGSRYFNFFVVFVGLVFASFIKMPDEWRTPAQLILAFVISVAVAKFAASNH